MPIVDYLPVATGGGADVDTQAEFAGSGYQQNGFVVGIAQPSQANKVWRQSSMIASAIATAISELLNIDILDDGNLANLVANFKAALATSASGGVLTQATRPFGDNTNDVANTAFVQAAVSPVSAAAGAAQTTANTGVANAATAQGTANTALADAVAAQTTATTALANAATAQTAANAAQTTANTALADIGAIVTRGPLITNANGSYIRWSDGLVEAWGTSPASSGVGTNAGTAAIVFPNTGGDAFTATPILIATPENIAGGGGVNSVSVMQAGTNTGGSTLHFNCNVPTGGGGANIPAGETASWYARGQ
jgi:hypothetical protein